MLILAAVTMRLLVVEDEPDLLSGLAHALRKEAYAVDTSSSNGSTDNLVTSDPESDRRIVARSDNGSVTVRYLD